jgi:hypothetical protein
MSTKDRGRTKIPMTGQGDTGPTKSNINRQIRTAGTNRPTGKADHLHRGDQRDRQPQK